MIIGKWPNIVMPKRGTLSTIVKTMMPGKNKNITSKLSRWSDDMLTEMPGVRACTAGGVFRHRDTHSESVE